MLRKPGRASGWLCWKCVIFAADEAADHPHRFILMSLVPELGRRHGQAHQSRETPHRNAGNSSMGCLSDMSMIPSNLPRDDGDGTSWRSRMILNMNAFRPPSHAWRQLNRI